MCRRFFNFSPTSDKAVDAKNEKRVKEKGSWISCVFISEVENLLRVAHVYSRSARGQQRTNDFYVNSLSFETEQLQAPPLDNEQKAKGEKEQFDIAFKHGGDTIIGAIEAGAKEIESGKLNISLFLTVCLDLLTYR